MNTDIENEPTVPEQEEQALRLVRRPDVPVTLQDLAARKGEAIEIIEARVQILTTLRRASLRATNPENWVLFRTREGNEYAYLEDSGGDIIRPLWGIQIYNVSDPEKIASNDPLDFVYLVTGNGRCTITGEIVENIEGGRSSKSDHVKGKIGAELDYAVRKAARANLDGTIVRELAGMKNVPAAELDAAWAGTDKTTARCAHGRGFGTADERRGMGSEQPPDDAGALTPPACHLCQKAMRLVKGSKGWFYSCPDYKQHGTEARGINLDAWKKNPLSRPRTQQAEPAQTPPQTQARTAKATPPPENEVFGNHERQPGEEG